MRMLSGKGGHSKMMASYEQESTKLTGFMINCRSRRSVKQYVIKTVEEEFDKTISNYTLCESDRQRYKERLREIYEGAFQQGILVDGHEWTDDIDSQDETTEYESVDQAKKHYINFDLVQMMDDAMVQLGDRRRTCPQKMKSVLSKILDLQLEKMAKLKVSCRKPMQTKTTDEAHLMLGSRKELLKSASVDLSTLNKKIKDSAEKAQSYNVAVQMMKKCEKCQVNKVIYKDCVNTRLLQRSHRKLNCKMLTIKTAPYSSRNSPRKVGKV